VSQRPRSSDTEEAGDGGRRAEGRRQTIEDRVQRTDFTGGNRENGGCFFIRAIRVIRGEKVWNVGREDAQKARKSESDFVTETTER
jgi:hypothetical protein